MAAAVTASNILQSMAGSLKKGTTGRHGRPASRLLSPMRGERPAKVGFG
jgi:hypothetical protein